MRKKWWKHCGGGIIFSVLFISVLLSVSSARAETEGKGARIIQYGVPEQARFHLGDVAL